MSAAAELVRVSRSLFERGYSFGTAGNVSVRAGDIVYATPTGSSLGELADDSIAQVDLAGNVLNGVRPTKEIHFHLAAYTARRGSAAVVHLHSTWATALSCLDDLDESDALPVLTPYYAMRVPALPVVPYLPPGAQELAAETARCAALSPAFLLRNHGSVAIGTTLFEAAALAEEIEEAAKLYLLLGSRARALTAEQVNDLRGRRV